LQPIISLFGVIGLFLTYWA